MRLIIGGAFQGKKEYVKEQFGIRENQITDGAEADFDAVFRCVCMTQFHQWVKRGLQEGWNFDGLEERLLKENPQVILVSNELGYGVVPIEAFDREYRELTGRLCTRIAAKSRQVIRVICGIGTVIKDA